MDQILSMLRGFSYLCTGSTLFCVDFQPTYDGVPAFIKDFRSACKPSSYPTPMAAFRAWLEEPLTQEDIDELIGFDPNEYNPYGF